MAGGGRRAGPTRILAAPPRSEYVRTPGGVELCDLLIVMAMWGDRLRAGASGPPAVRRHRTSGEVTHAELRCAHCGEPVTAATVDVLPGPGSAGHPG